MGAETFAHMADLDPLLERQLVQAAADEPIEAIVFLREHNDASAKRSDVAALLKRVCRGEHAGSLEHTYLPHMGALIVRAYPRIIRRLIAQPEVEIACANRGEPALTASRSSQAAR